MTGTTIRRWRTLANPGRLGWRGLASLVTGLVVLALCGSLAGVASAAPRTSRATVPAATLLNGVSCANAAHCWAVGVHTSQTKPELPAIERFSGGTWSAVRTPLPAGASSGQLGGVWCTGVANCVAAGFYESGGNSFPLAERWDGTAWSLLAASAAGSKLSSLSAVACPGARDCWAVGDRDHGDRTSTLIEHWNGAAWSVVGSPSVARFSVLRGVACPQARSCWAVGLWDSRSGSVYGTLTLHWDGTAWSKVTTSTSGKSQSMFNGVSCSSASACMAVGSQGGKALTQRWNGSAWSTMVASVPGIALSGDSCTGASACVAVGAQLTGPDSEQTAAIRWNGAGWSQQGTPNPAHWPISLLDGVSCVTRADCWAAGGTLNPGAPGLGQRIIEHWNGTRWSLVH